MVPRDSSYPIILKVRSGIKTLNFGISGNITFDGLRRLRHVLEKAPGIPLSQYLPRSFS